MLKNIGIVLIVLGSFGFITLGSTFHEETKPIDPIEGIAVYEPVVVLELFTSQGCSSCPSADVLLEKVKKEFRKEVFALSYHVDYWNYIGWKDPFSKSQYAKKQNIYNVKFRNNSNYTPQLVVNGKAHFVGSNNSKMYASIADYKAQKVSNEVEIKNVERKKGAISLNYEVKGSLKNKKVRVLLVIDERITNVKRGENRNRTLKNSNIVVAEAFYDLKSSAGSASIEIPKLIAKDDRINVMVLVENERYDITAAAKQALIQ